MLIKKKKKENRQHWCNQKYALAIDKLPVGHITIEQYVKQYLPMLDRLQTIRFGKFANKEYKGPINFVKDKKYIAVRYYTKEFLDNIFIKFAQLY